MSTRRSPLEKLAALLPVPSKPYFGRGTGPLPLPDKVFCFFRRFASELNTPKQGRALHHRYVLILALQTAVTVSVDQRVIRLNPGQGLLIFPFQFHHYLHPEREDLRWLFVTFDMLDGTAIQSLRLRPFAINQPVMQTAVDLLNAYLTPDETDVAALQLSVLLTRISRSEPILRRDQKPPVAPELIMQINKQAQKDGGAVTAKEMARSLGVSPSHLRARFRASIGDSPGRHMRRMRLEKACGMLRLGESRVTEIAELCGFNSIYSFSRAFQTAYGVSPMAFRRGARPTRKVSTD